MENLIALHIVVFMFSVVEEFLGFSHLVLTGDRVCAQYSGDRVCAGETPRLLSALLLEKCMHSQTMWNGGLLSYPHTYLS